MLGNNEDVLFKHSAKYLQYPSEEGSFYVTNLRIVWESRNPSLPLFITPWIEVDQLKYSVPKSLVNIQSTKSSAGSIFELIASRPDQSKLEVERLKGIVKNIRSGTTTAQTNSAHGLLRASAASVEIDYMKKDNSEQKLKLLEADSHLRNQYRELVTDGKLISDADFWSTRQHLLSEREIIDASAKRGMVPSMVDKKLLSHGNKVTLTTELIQRIFLLYPTVEIVYQAKVPLEMTEQEFWSMYFQSEYFLRDQGQRGGASNTAAIQHTEDMFSRVEDERARGAAVSGSNKLARVSELVCSSMDLTSSVGDFHAPESGFLGDVGSLHAQDQSQSKGFRLGSEQSASSSSLLTSKYNKNSDIIMSQSHLDYKHSKGIDRFPINPTVGDMMELMDDSKKQTYVPLELKTDSNRTLHSLVKLEDNAKMKRKYAELNSNSFQIFMTNVVPSSERARLFLRQTALENAEYSDVTRRAATMNSAQSSVSKSSHGIEALSSNTAVPLSHSLLSVHNEDVESEKMDVLEDHRKVREGV